MNPPELPPPPKELRYSIHQLRKHYSDLVHEYERKIQLAKNRLDTLVEIASDFESDPYMDGLCEAVIKSKQISQVEEENNLEEEEEEEEQQPAIELSVEKSITQNIDVLPAFKTLTRLSAIEQILETNKGKALHPLVIVRELYGDFPKSWEKILLNRVRLVLNKGEKDFLWFKVPNSGGCYTSDLIELAA